MPPSHPCLSLKSSGNSGLCYLSFHAFAPPPPSGVPQPLLQHHSSHFAAGAVMRSYGLLFILRCFSFNLFFLVPSPVHSLAASAESLPPAPLSSCSPPLSVPHEEDLLPSVCCVPIHQRSSHKRLLSRGLSGGEQCECKCVSLKLKLVPQM